MLGLEVQIYYKTLFVEFSYKYQISSPVSCCLLVSVLLRHKEKSSFKYYHNKTCTRFLLFEPDHMWLLQACLSHSSPLFCHQFHHRHFFHGKKWKTATRLQLESCYKLWQSLIILTLITCIITEMTYLLYSIGHIFHIFNQMFFCDLNCQI